MVGSKFLQSAVYLIYIYHEIPIICPGLGSLFSKGLIIGGNFAFQNGLGLTIKTA